MVWRTSGRSSVYLWPVGGGLITEEAAAVECLTHYMLQEVSVHQAHVGQQGHEEGFWSGMYTRFEKGMHPRQSVTDYLMAVKEETQQLEEELEVLEQRLADLKKVQLNNRKENSKQQDQNTHLGLSTSNNSIANTPQDYINNVKSFPSRSPSQGDEEDSALILTQDNLKSSDPDLSAISDQESGVEDLNCRSPSGGCLPSEDSGKDSDEAVLVTV
ncbi:Myotubularin-related protein 7 [Chelonia mydas]|uniref:Myotubularin-related protein 7 n=1 Tax=Chelonia mydas TaxID=8469 RepID=M7B7K9_CHEMY|nr:Myotubularin-related protein 7 [Chelonia mydas]